MDKIKPQIKLMHEVAHASDTAGSQKIPHHNNISKSHKTQTMPSHHVLKSKAVILKDKHLQEPHGCNA